MAHMMDHDIHEADMQRYLAADNDEDELLLDPQIRDLEVAHNVSGLANRLTDNALNQDGSRSDNTIQVTQTDDTHLQSTGAFMPSPDLDDEGEALPHAAGPFVSSVIEESLDTASAGIRGDDSKATTLDDPWPVSTLDPTLEAAEGRKEGDKEEYPPGTPAHNQEGLSIDDDMSPNRMTSASQLQTMADLLHRHQMKQIERSRRLEDLKALDIQSSTSTHGDDAEKVSDENSDGNDESTILQPDKPLSGPSASQGAGSGRLADDTVPGSPEQLNGPSTSSSSVLGKRKDRPDSPTSDYSRSSTQRASAGEALAELDTAGEESTPSDIDGKRRRRARKRKPLQEAMPKAGTSRSGKGVAVSPQAQRLKRESRRRWVSLEPYVTMMMMLLKTLMGSGWQVLVDSVAKVSLPHEQKDTRRIKQTWANEYTRLKAQGIKGRLVTLQQLNSSWPWSLEEKKQLWKTGVELCVEKADWDRVTTEVNKSAKNVHEAEVTTEECRAEWDDVLKYEYMDEDPNDGEPLYALPSSESVPATTHTGAKNLSSAPVPLIDPELQRDHSAAALRMLQGDAGPTSLLDNRSAYHFALNDYVNADIIAPRLGDMFSSDSSDPRPVNQPLQVQPPRPDDIDNTGVESPVREANTLVAMVEETESNRRLANQHNSSPEKNETDEAVAIQTEGHLEASDVPIDGALLAGEAEIAITTDALDEVTNLQDP